MTNALVVGSGGREHAIAWKLKQSKQVDRVFVAPGNGGTFEYNIPIGTEDIDSLLTFARNRKCFTVVGPEAPLAAGIVDRFRDEGLRIFGPSAKEARLETSKSFAKQFMVSNGIPTANFGVFEDSKDAIDFAYGYDGLVAVKVDGLAGGKGVHVCGSTKEAETSIKKILEERAFGEAGRKIVVEQRLEGTECSIMTICNGKDAFFFGSARDHKRAFDHDNGPNTGGMGAFSPADNMDEDSINYIMEKVAKPAARASNFQGFLYVGLILTSQGPKVLEFNARLGDPETQVIMPRLDNDLAEILMNASDTSQQIELQWSSLHACTVVMCSEGYPNKPRTGDLIEGLDHASETDGVLIFHSGSQKNSNDYFTTGGRVLSVTGLGSSIKSAVDRAYTGVRMISWKGEHHRNDIGRVA